MATICYSICVEPISVHGIKILDENMSHRSNGRLGQVPCVVVVKLNKNIRSQSSLPLMKSIEWGHTARWYYDNRRAEGDDNIKFNAKLDGQNPKEYNFTVCLQRGNELIEIGLTSLVFVGGVLGVELDIPIYSPQEATAKLQRGGLARGFFLRSKKNYHGITSKLYSNGHTQMHRFKGGDGGRSYALKEGAFIRVRVSTLAVCILIPSNFSMNNS